MKINVVIRIEDSNDPGTHLESKFKECDSEKILADEKLKWAHGLVRQYVDFFEE